MRPIASMRCVVVTDTLTYQGCDPLIRFGSDAQAGHDDRVVDAH